MFGLRCTSRCERFDARPRGRVERLDERDHEVHGAVEVGTIDNAVVRMRGTGRNKHRGYRDSAVVKFYGPGVIAESRDKIELQRNVLICGNLFDMRDEV